ncbi:MAG: hypothetical protein J6Y60_03030 [Treponema sp.]|nr:hypothetical protein [Treponema sp.]
MNETNAYDVWNKVIESHLSVDTAETWKNFWDDQDPLSDEEFELLKNMCYSGNQSPEEHDLLFKMVNRELTLRIKNHREQEVSEIAVAS